MYRVVITISILMLFLSVIDSLVSGSPNSRYIKGIVLVISVIIIIDYLSSLKNIEFNIDKQSDFKINQENAWNISANNVSSLLENDIEEYLANNSIDCKYVNVKVSTDYSDFKIESVKIACSDFESAKILINSHFGINKTYIVNSGELYE